MPTAWLVVHPAMHVLGLNCSDAQVRADVGRGCREYESRVNAHANSLPISELTGRKSWNFAMMLLRGRWRCSYAGAYAIGESILHFRDGTAVCKGACSLIDALTGAWDG